MDDLDQQLLDLLNSGQKLEAVKLLREQTGSSLVEAKQYVEELERTQQPGDGMDLDKPTADELDRQLIELLRMRQKIEAVKVYRQATGSGLKDAKDYVDELQRRHDLPSSGCASGIFCLLLLAALVGGLTWQLL